MIRLVLSLTLAFSALAVAQNKGGDITIRFLAERVPDQLGEVELVAEESRSAQFSLPTNNLSEPQDAPGRAFGLVPAGGEKPLAKIKLPDEGKDFIVLLIPNKTAYHPVVIAAESANFKPGDVYFFNSSNSLILGFVGTAKFTLSPGKGKSVRPKGARPEGFYDVGFGVKEKEGNRTLSTTRWPVEEQIRSYVFFFMNPSTKRIDFRAVDEFIMPKAPTG